MVPIGHQTERDVDLCHITHQSCASLGMSLGTEEKRASSPYSSQTQLPLRTFKAQETSLQSIKKTTKTAIPGHLSFHSLYTQILPKEKVPQSRALRLTYHAAPQLQ